MKKNMLLLCLLIFRLTFYSAAQLPSNSQTVQEASALASGNYRDAFNGFFQFAFDKITSKQKEISFTSNPYAVMAKLDSNLFSDQNYYRYRHLRNLNLSFAGKLDSAYRFNGFSMGLKYALINKRDETVSRAFLADVLYDKLVSELLILNNEMSRYVSTLAGDCEKQTRVMTDFDNFKKGKINFDQLDTDLQNFIQSVMTQQGLVNLAYEIKEDASFNFAGSAAAAYESIKQTYNNKLLWTVALHDTTYTDQLLFSNVVISSGLVKGILKPRAACNLEINLNACLQLSDDMTITGRDLSRKIFGIEPGLNLVLKAAQSDKSYLEFKFSAVYRHIFSSLYLPERREQVSVNGIVRIRVVNDVWIPVEVNYDPYTGNVLGFLTVRANFTSLNNLAGR